MTGEFSEILCGALRLQEHALIVGLSVSVTALVGVKKVKMRREETIVCKSGAGELRACESAV